MKPQFLKPCPRPSHHCPPLAGPLEDPFAVHPKTAAPMNAPSAPGMAPSAPDEHAIPLVPATPSEKTLEMTPAPVPEQPMPTDPNVGTPEQIPDVPASGKSDKELQLNPVPAVPAEDSQTWIEPQIWPKLKVAPPVWQQATPAATAGWPRIR